MGDPKSSRRKYDKPSHPWRADRIKAERELVKRYGLKNKRELWKAQSELRALRSQSRDLQARLRTGDKQAEIETTQLLNKCGRLGLLPIEETTLNDVLSLNVENLLTRRFQTMVFQMGLAYSPTHARQLIVHGHIAIGERCVTIPGYIVKRAEEEEINYALSSPISDDLHPMHPKPKDAVELEIEKAREDQEKREEEEKPAAEIEEEKGEHPAEKKKARRQRKPSAKKEEEKAETEEKVEADSADTDTNKDAELAESSEEKTK